MLVGKPKGKPDAEPEGEEPSASAEQSYAREAFAALQDDDEEGFVTAFLGAVRACSGKSKAGGYEEKDDDSDDAA